MLHGGIDPEFVLNRWSEGYRSPDIIAQMRVPCTPARISQIIDNGRRRGDPRAIRRRDPDACSHGERGQFSHDDVMRMDARFKARMLRAVRLGKEKPPLVGVFKSVSTSVPLRFTSTGYVASASSIALCSEERAAASDQSRSHARAGA